jgi:uncharacterized SAM-binding protein YcdF (DUF218 family)
MAKLLDLLLQPLGLLWLGLILYAGWRCSRRRWRSAIFPMLLAAAIYVVGGTSLPASLLATFERPYVGVRPELVPEADAVVVLGGMTTPSTNDVFGFHLDGEMDRLVAGVELTRQRKARALVLGGGLNRNTQNPGEGEFLRHWVEHWEVAKAPVFVLGICRNTRDEAVRTRDLAEAQGWKRIVLVTSACHMPRAEGTFRHVGLEVTPFACDFVGLAALAEPRFKLVPSLSGFEHLGRYLHELAGSWAYRWRGWL